MEEMLISYVNLEPLTIVYLLNLDGRKISKEPIETQMTTEMNFIIFYNANTLSQTVRTSSQVSLEKGQIFLNLSTLNEKITLLCKMTRAKYL